MELVDVLLLLPRRLEKAIYTYAVPPALNSRIGFGQRALVPVAGRRQEGIVLGPAERVPSGRCAGIIKLLDQEPVVNPDLLELADWMTRHYASSLAQVIKGIIPGFLRHRGQEQLAALVAREDFPGIDMPALTSDQEEFMEQLWEEGSLSVKDAARAIGDEGVSLLEAGGWIVRVKEYGFSGSMKPAAVYTALPASGEEMQALGRKAPRQAEFMNRLAEAGSLPREEALRLAGPRVLKELQHKGLVKMEMLQPLIQSEPAFILTPEQVEVIERLKLAINAVQALPAGLEEEFREYLLWGITGSGKTEIYINLSLEMLSQGRSVLMLVPEIALTRQLVSMFTARIGEVAVMHSDMPALERYETWIKIKHGEARMVIGARSAVFAPLENLGLIIIDEEQENSYKQEESPRYHVRDIARKRAEHHGALLLLGSATPSLETFHRAMTGQIGMLELKQRIGGGAEPIIIVDDMRKLRHSNMHAVIAPLLEQKIRDRIAENEQVIIFLNRRGYRPVTLCRSCGRSRSCPNCSVSLNFHRDLNSAICHYCGYREEPQAVCSICGSSLMDMAGFGTQTVEEEARRLFPEARVARLDTDSSRRRGEQERILTAMKNREIDILVGTQMVAKGLDFPMVSLVGVLGADQMLSLPDFRAGERAFQLIVQASGRAGRAKGGAEVVVQTYNPDSDVIKMAVIQDYAAFYLHEIRQRKLLEYPPFTNILRVVASSEDEGLCHQRIADIIEYSGELLDAREEETVFLGPAACPIYRLRNRFRCQFLVKSASEELISSLGCCLARLPAVEDCRLEIDLNPLNLM